MRGDAILYLRDVVRISNHDQEDARLLRLIRASFVASHGIYGAPRVFLDLREAGESCSKHRVARLMREANFRLRSRATPAPITIWLAGRRICARGTARRPVYRAKSWQRVAESLPNSSGMAVIPLVLFPFLLMVHTRVAWVAMATAIAHLRQTVLRPAPACAPTDRRRRQLLTATPNAERERFC